MNVTGVELQSHLGACPGRTSMIRTPRGVMTLQTEIAGEPLEVVTIVDFRGRVLKRFSAAIPDEIVGEAELMRFANDHHGRVEDQVHASLEAARRRVRPEAPDIGGAVAELFMQAMQAYARQELATAEAVLRACDALLPNDRRVRAALGQLERRRR